jgi:translocation and assembly module TamB
LRRALISLAVGAVIGGVLLVAALLLLDSGAGRRLVERAANAALAGTARVVGLGEGFPGALRLDRLELLDAEGVWATAEDVSIDWSLGALLRRKVKIENFSVAEAVVHRAPVAAEGAPPSESGGGLPVAIEIERASIASLRLEGQAPGGPATFAVEASARLPRDLSEIAARLGAERLDAPGRLAASIGRDGEVYRIEASLDEPAGGVLARLLQLGDAPPLSLSLNGDGPLDNFDLHFQGAAGKARASGDARLRRGETGVGFEANASGEFAAFLPERFRALAGPRIALEAKGQVKDDGAARLDSLSAQAAALELRGAGALAADRTLSGELTASGQLDVLASVAEMTGSGAWRLDSTFAGSLEAPRAQWRLRLDEPRVGEHSAESLSLDGTAAMADGVVRLEARAEAVKPMSPGAPLPAEIAAELRAQAAMEGGEVAIERASLVGGPYSLSAQGRVGPDLKLALDVQASAADLAAFGLQGAAEATASVAGPPDALEAKLDARFAKLRFDQPQLDAALGPAPTVHAELRRDGEALRVERLEAKGAHFGLTGSGALVGERIETKAALSAPDLAAIGAPAPGKAALQVELAGALDDLSGPVSLTAQTGELRLSAKAQARLDAQRFSLADLRLDGTGLTGEGAVSVPRAGGAPEGRLSAKVADLGPWAALLDAPAGGAAVLEARLSGGALDANLRGRQLRWADAGAVGGLEASARLKDVFSKPAGPLKATIRGASFGDMAIRELGLDARLSGEKADFNLRAEAPGVLDEPLSASGAIGWAEGERRTLASLRTKARGLAIRLAGATSLSRRGEELAVDGLDLRVGAGRLAAEARLGPKQVDGRISARAFPLAPFLGDAAGELDGEVRLAGAAQAPSGEADLRLTPAREGLPPELAKLALLVQGRLKDGRMSLTARAAGAPGTDVVAEAALPLQADFAARRFALPPDGRLSGELRIAADLAQLSTLLPLDGSRIGGRLDGALTLGGTVSAPDLAGQAALADGRYDNAALGTRLRDLRLRLRGDGKRIVLEDLAATDGGGGTLAGEGAVALDAGQVQASVRFARFQAANTDDVQALASGDLRLGGPLSGPTLAGTVRIEEAEIAIPRKLPSSVVSLDVVEINRPPGMKRLDKAESKKGGASPFALLLDIAVKAPGQVFVRGRGLDSEWRGDLHVGGSTAEPKITGELNVVRGRFDLAGNRLEITSGKVSFPEGRRVKVEPDLDIVAAAQAQELRAELRISGPISDIRISFTSQPSMPSDEILSRLLFGKSASTLTAAQAFQLGQTALALSGHGGGGLLTDIRERFGLDFLDVESGEGEDVGSAQLSAGKYLRDDVYVGVKQGAQAGSSSAVIEYKFLPSLSLEGTVGANSETGVGLNWEKRY